MSGMRYTQSINVIVAAAAGGCITWKPRVRAAVLKVSATRRNSVTVNKALSLSSATTFDDLGT